MTAVIALKVLIWGISSAMTILVLVGISPKNRMLLAGALSLAALASQLR